MKINYIHQYFTIPSSNGGVRSYEIARRLVKWGHKVNMLCLNTDSKREYKAIEKCDNIVVHYCPLHYSQRYGFIRRLFVFIFFSIWASWKNIRLKSDLTYASSTPLTVGIPAVLGKILAGRKYIFEVRDVWPEVPLALGYLKHPILKYLAEMLEKKSYRYSSKIVTLSPDMAKSIKVRLGFDSLVVPNFASLDFLERTSNVKLRETLKGIRSKHDYLIGYTGAIGKVNDLSYLVRLINLSKLSLGLVILGHGNDEEVVKKLASDLGLIDNGVYFLDPVPKSSLHIVHDSIHIAASTVRNVPALFSNSANKVFDAFSVGTPILINHDGWLRKLIDKEGCGIGLSSRLNEAEVLRFDNYLTSNDEYNESRLNAKKLASKFHPDYLCKLIESEMFAINSES